VAREPFARSIVGVDEVSALARDASQPEDVCPLCRLFRPDESARDFRAEALALIS
jgi:hypothetical protein